MAEPPPLKKRKKHKGEPIILKKRKEPPRPGVDYWCPGMANQPTTHSRHQANQLSSEEGEAIVAAWKKNGVLVESDEYPGKGWLGRVAMWGGIAGFLLFGFKNMGINVLGLGWYVCSLAPNKEDGYAQATVPKKAKPDWMSYKKMLVHPVVWRFLNGWAIIPEGMVVSHRGPDTRLMALCVESAELNESRKSCNVTLSSRACPHDWGGTPCI